MVIFLDFDGVLRRNASPPMTFDADCLAFFEGAVRSIPRARIVITSSWRDVEALAAIRARFSPDMALRVVGAIPTVLRTDDFPRHREVLAYLRNEGLENEPWVALEDDPSAYPATAPVLLTDADLGFDGSTARRLLEMTRSFTR